MHRIRGGNLFGRSLILAVAINVLPLGCGSVTPAAPSGTGGGSAGAGGSSLGGSGMGGTAGSGGTASPSGTGGASGTGGSDGGDGGVQCAATCPAGTWDLDGNPATGVCGCEYACNKVSDADPIDPSYADDNCDGSDGVVAQCVFVSATTGSIAGPGTRQQPFSTIAAGVAAARMNGMPAVCVAGGSYNEAVSVVSGVSIYGGFDAGNASFAFRRSASAVTTVTATGTVFDAATIDAETHLEGLTIKAATPSTPGGSTYGVRLGGGTGRLFVRYDAIAAGKGADGADGPDGATVSPTKAPDGNPGVNGVASANSGGTGGPRPTCVEYGGAGGPGGYGTAPGSSGLPGTGGTMVGAPGQANSASLCLGVTGVSMGGTGAPHLIAGASGTNGAGGAAVGKIAGGLYTPADGGSGTSGANGKGGSGGGGGGGGDAGSLCVADHGGGGGSGGCGGLGGNFGAKGGGGGGSFAVFVAAGSITMTDDDITTVGGGKGGKGGKGTAGQAGGGGAMGGSAADDGGGGGPGGAGSAGGVGGPGGGGGGGPSACLAHAAGTSVVFMNVACASGTPAPGGQGGTNPSGGVGGNGSAGTVADNLQIN